MHRYEGEEPDGKHREEQMNKLNREVNEEAAADFAAGTFTERRREDAREDFETSETRSMGYSLGWVSLVFAIASWFIWPVLLGITSAVLGFIAYRQGARKLGAWSMGLGLVAAAVYLFIIPLYYAFT